MRKNTICRIVDIPQVPAKARNARIVYINPRHWQLTAQEYAESLVEHLRALAAEKLPDKQRILLSESNPMISPELCGITYVWAPYRPKILWLRKRKMKLSFR